MLDIKKIISNLLFINFCPVRFLLIINDILTIMLGTNRNNPTPAVNEAINPKPIKNSIIDLKNGTHSQEIVDELVT